MSNILQRIIDAADSLGNHTQNYGTELLWRLDKLIALQEEETLSGTEYAKRSFLLSTDGSTTEATDAQFGENGVAYKLEGWSLTARGSGALTGDALIYVDSIADGNLVEVIDLTAAAAPLYASGEFGTSAIIPEQSSLVVQILGVPNNTNVVVNVFGRTYSEPFSQAHGRGEVNPSRLGETGYSTNAPHLASAIQEPIIISGNGAK